MKRVFLVAATVASLVGTSCGAEYFTEYFTSSQFDLNGLSMTFTPVGDTNFTANAVSITDFPVSHAGHTVISMDNFWPADVDFPDDKLFPFYGVQYTGLFMGATGNFTFDSDDWYYYGSIARQFTQPRISTLWADLEPENGGTVKVGFLGDRFVLTFIDTPLYSGRRVSFQTELHYDGVIVMSWLDVQAPGQNVLVGLSAGGGTPPDFIESDLSEFARDRDEDGMLDAWERLYFASHEACITTNDVDGDGYDNYAEFVSGTIPNDAASYFSITNTRSATGPIVTWPTTEGRTYNVLHSPNLVSGFAPLQSGLDYPVNAFTSSASAVSGFYKVEVELQE